MMFVTNFHRFDKRINLKKQYNKYAQDTVISALPLNTIGHAHLYNRSFYRQK